MKNKLVEHLSDVKLEIIQKVIECAENKENEMPLFRMLGYLEGLVDKNS